jgi:hypothetical protein
VDIAFAGVPLFGVTLYLLTQMLSLVIRSAEVEGAALTNLKRVVEASTYIKIEANNYVCTICHVYSSENAQGDHAEAVHETPRVGRRYPQEIKALNYFYIFSRILEYSSSILEYS